MPQFEKQSFQRTKSRLSVGFLPASNSFLTSDERTPGSHVHHLQLQLLAGPNAIIRALTNADIAFGFLGIVSLDYTKVMGAFLSVAIAAAFFLGPAVVGYV